MIPGTSLSPDLAALFFWVGPEAGPRGEIWREQVPSSVLRLRARRVAQSTLAQIYFYS